MALEYTLLPPSFVGKMAERSKACDSSEGGKTHRLPDLIGFLITVIVAWVRIPLLSNFLSSESLSVTFLL